MTYHRDQRIELSARIVRFEEDSVTIIWDCRAGCLAVGHGEIEGRSVDVCMERITRQIMETFHDRQLIKPRPIKPFVRSPLDEINEDDI